MKKPWATHCIFCEDAREEVGHKLSLMGILMSGEMNIMSPPATAEAPVVLAKIVVVVYIIVDIDDIPSRIKLRVLSPYQKQQIALIEGDTPPLQHAEDATKAVIITNIVLQPLVLQSDGYLEVFLDLDGEETKAGRLKIGFISSPPA